MSVPAPTSQPRTAKASRTARAVPPAVLLVTAAAAGGVSAAAPEAARGWTLAVAGASWLCLSCAVLVGSRLSRRARRTADQQATQISALHAQLAQQHAASLHVANVALPAVSKQLLDGASADEALAGAASVAEPELRRITHSFATLMEDAVRQAAAVRSEHDEAQRETAQAAAELERLTERTLPAAIDRLREGASAEVVLAELDWPTLPLLRTPAERFIREMALSERRAAAAQAASAKALSRVQAKAVSMLADLREMQERHGEEVFGDLLRLDHSTSQLGLMTDRLALLMGGRSSRAWNKPIVMESILRGAVGRIAAYQRVRMHCSTQAAISGYAAEGVMHLLAELMDNAANFSPPIDEVHVYVEERTAGIVVTIEDSGLKMADAAMRHAEKAVAGQATDLASLQGTRLGLAVVGRLAAKYRISINFRPSSRGGTGVVVLLPPQLLAQQREPAPTTTESRAEAVIPTPGPAPAVESDLFGPDRPDTPRATEPEPFLPRPSGSTPNGLPVRAPGRTMAEAELERQQRKSADDAPARDASRPGARGAARDAGARFGAFHRGRRSGAGGGVPSGEAEPEPPASE
ncbi:sensor histidine kinase [Streptomyces sp. NPDC004629]|uniref:sensor histidine kinase n=1 Tax=Streptomyces sp. NPDC004629 TaxID=3364705 RepID=UPI0036B0BFB5